MKNPPKLRHVWRGYASEPCFFGGPQTGGGRWPERWIVTVVQRRDAADTRWDFHVRAELRGTKRPERWCCETERMLPADFDKGPAGVVVPAAGAYVHKTLGQARADGLRLARCLMYENWRDRRL
jgi:hypothetical protein